MRLYISHNKADTRTGKTQSEHELTIFQASLTMPELAVRKLTDVLTVASLHFNYRGLLIRRAMMRNLNAVYSFREQSSR